MANSVADTDSRPSKRPRSDSVKKFVAPIAPALPYNTQEAYNVCNYLIFVGIDALKLFRALVQGRVPLFCYCALVSNPPVLPLPSACHFSLLVSHCHLPNTLGASSR